jgi:hypothetical protein
MFLLVFVIPQLLICKDTETCGQLQIFCQAAVFGVIWVLLIGVVRVGEGGVILWRDCYWSR